MPNSGIRTGIERTSKWMNELMNGCEEKVDTNDLLILFSFYSVYDWKEAQKWTCIFLWYFKDQVDWRYVNSYYLSTIQHSTTKGLTSFIPITETQILLDKMCSNIWINKSVSNILLSFRLTNISNEKMNWFNYYEIPKKNRNINLGFYYINWKIE